MRSLILFILKYQNFILFLLLELASLLLVINKNTYQNAKFYTWSLATMGNVYERQSELSDFLSLKVTNEELVNENAILKELLIKGSSSSSNAYLSIQDPLADKDVTIIPAKVVSASVNHPYNLFTINVGRADSVGVDMAVVGPLGAVGVVKSVSRNYAMVMPLINVQYRVSSKLKGSDYFGTLRWNTRDYRYASLEGVEQHVQVAIGDTIITSGYGATFPEGVMVGIVEGVEEGEEGVFHAINVEMATDFKRVSYVYVIKNNTRKERVAIEKATQNK
jgi:rod shape-determining protein MreC